MRDQDGLLTINSLRLAPSSTVCPRNTPKMPQNAPRISTLWLKKAKTRNGSHLGHLVHPNSALFLFVVSAPQNCPNSCVDPCAGLHQDLPRQCTEPNQLGLQLAYLGSPGAPQTTLSKGFPGPLGMPKQVFLAHFEPVLSHFGSQRVKTGQGRIFSNRDRGPLGMSKQEFTLF